MHSAMIAHLTEVRTLCRRFGVARLDVFGSAARADDFDEARSDIDLVVEFHRESALPPLEQFFGLSEALERVFGRPVDLVEAGAIRNPFLLMAIDRDRDPIYAG